MSAAQQEVFPPRLSKAQCLTLDGFITQTYLPHVKLRKRSWQIDERLARRHISPVFGHRKLKDIKPFEIDKWLTDLRSRGLTPATCNRILAAFKTVCVLAEKSGYLKAGGSPCRSVKQFKIRHCRERFLTRDEGRRLVAELVKYDRLEAKALRLLLLTGARKSEIIKARWEDLDYEGCTLLVPLAKSGRERRIYLSPEAVAVFKSIEKVKESPWIFPGRKPDKPLADLYKFWVVIRGKLNLVNMRIHDLRHTFASWLVSSGHTLYEVQQLLGHSDPRTTIRYAHFAQAALLKAVRDVMGFINDAPKEGKEINRTHNTVGKQCCKGAAAIAKKNWGNIDKWKKIVEF